MALGVNDYLTSESSPISDLSNFAVFGSDNDPEVLAEIQASATDESVLRGATQLGGPITDTYQIILGFANDLYEGKEVPEEDIAEVFPITVSNVEDYVH
jgi:ABC-type sugar transport system substrate-binding protein